MLSFQQQLTVGQAYERKTIASLLGYADFRAIAKGVVTPSGSNLIILFVTKEKQASLTQYRDFIDSGFLFWEGESRHGTDERIGKAAENEDEIVLFFRNRHHSPFIYMGQVFLTEFVNRFDKPSEFIFSLTPAEVSAAKTVTYETIDQSSSEFIALHETDREQLTTVRVGQNNFRKNLIKIWGKCSVTGVENLEFLHASHIKPWRQSNNDERLTPFNGLLLNPALDKAFDRGFIGFETTGKIVISNKLSREDAEKMAINQNLKLRQIYPGNLQYLSYHLENLFEKVAA